MQKKKIMMHGKTLFMGLKIEYYNFLHRMIWKLTAVMNKQIF